MKIFGWLWGGGLGESENKEKRIEKMSQAKQLCLLLKYKAMPSQIIIFKTTQKKMYNRFYELGNMDLYSCHDLDNPSALSPDFRKAQDPTSLGNAPTDECEFFYQKSTNNLTGGYEISFQKDFMKDHQMVYERELQNLMESFGIPKNCPSSDQSFNIFPAPKVTHSFNSVQDLIRSETLNLSSERVENLLEKLNEYDKLEEFLDLVVGQTETQISVVLVDLTEKIVECYQKVKIEEPNESELMKMALEVARQVDIERLTSVKEVSSDNINEKAKRFLEVFATTSILVAAQYFQNPYSEDESGCLKRPLSPWSLEDSEEEESFEPTPSKKRKFSF